MTVDSRGGHYRQDLSNIVSLAWMQQYVAPYILPPLPHDAVAGNIAIISDKRAFDAYNVADGQSGGGGEINLVVESTSFNCKPYRCTLRVSKFQEASHASDLGEAAASRCGGVLSAAHERRTFAAVSTALSGHTSAATGTWGGGASDVYADVAVAHNSIVSRFGRRADAAVMNFAQYLKLSSDAGVLDRIKYISPAVQNGIMDTGPLAQALGVNRILIQSAVQNTADAKPGVAPTPGFILATGTVYFLLTGEATLNADGTIAVARGVTEAQIGRTICHTGYGGMMGVVMYEENGGLTQSAAAYHACDEKVFMPAGYMLTGA